ncbi:hypothetical protein AVEN_182076-1 [Araneus ventricosus]|uniref:Uncharacterized protein n=1 Tax=Araneus ventricosus TaxID=182803 RepID=A0A4Y2P804_ARAVE|nr:hypothetical protein AVEN_182076-1 [Araneus ventricosus]
MAVITCCSIAGSTEVQAACRRATKSICVVTTSRYTSSLRWPYRKKSNGVRSGERGGHRTGPPRPIQRPGYSISSQPRTGAQKCAGAFLLNYGSYRNASLGSFYELPTRNLAVQSLCGRFVTPCIFYCC